jgi:hypothetical protein
MVTFPMTRELPGVLLGMDAQKESDAVQKGVKRRISLAEPAKSS